MATGDPVSIAFPLNLGANTASLEDTVQPVGEGAALTVQANTRLTVVGGVPTKCPQIQQIAGLTVGGDAGGIVPAGHVDSSVLFYRPQNGGSRRIAAAFVGKLYSPLDATRANPQNCYWPALVTRAGAVPGARTTSAPAVVVSGGITYFASVRAYVAAGVTTYGVFLTALDANGSEMVAPTLAVASVGATFGTYTWCGLTDHGTNGLFLWWYSSTTGFISCASVSLSGLTLTVHATHTIYAPNGGAYPGTVSVSTSALGPGVTYAWLSCRATASANTLAVVRVDITGFTTTVATIALGAQLNCSSLAVLTVSSSTYVAVIVALSSGTCTHFLLDGSSMITSWSQAARQAWNFPAIQPPVAARFLVSGASVYAVFCRSDNFGDFVIPLSAGTMIEIRSVAAGALQSTLTIPWVQLVSRGCDYQISDTECYPVLALQVCYQMVNSSSLASEHYVSDPSVEVYLIGTTTQYACVGRIGVDRAVRLPGALGATYGIGLLNSDTSFVRANNKVLLTYVEDGTSPAGYASRYVELDFAAGQPRYAIDGDGAAIVAAALPIYWDGSECAEYTPMRSPRIHAFLGGLGPNLTGTYGFYAVYCWRDSTGQMRRSLPSLLYTAAPAAQPLSLRVTVPPTMRDGAFQDSFEIQIYASLAGGTVYFLQPYVVTTKSAYFWTYTTIPSTVEDETTPQLYTDGSPTQPLAAVCPGALLDVAVVADRCWGIDAERPAEVLCTKRKELTGIEKGIALEWAAELRTRFPASAGALMAVVENDGFPLFFSPFGVFTISGDGPDNSLQGVGFSAPQQISDIGCTSRASVVKTPVGVIYQSNNRFVLVGAAGARYFNDIDASFAGAISAAVVFRDQQEVVFFGADGTNYTYVYNYAVDAWSYWDATAFPVTPAIPTLGQVRQTLTANLYAPSTGAVYQLVPNTESTFAQASWSTGWILLGGPQDDSKVTDVIIQGYSGGDHGLSVLLWFDYGLNNQTIAFTAPQIAAASLNSRFTLSIAPLQMAMRAIKVQLFETDASANACNPLSVTLVVSRNRSVARASVLTAGRR